MRIYEINNYMAMWRTDEDDNNDIDNDDYVFYILCSKKIACGNQRKTWPNTAQPNRTYIIMKKKEEQ